MRLVRIKLLKILENPYNPRDFEEPRERRALNKLISSIQQVGLLTPLTVHVLKDGNGYYGLIAGHRRRRALLELGWEWAWCYVLDKPMTFKEALPLILHDQDFTRPYTAQQKVAVALRGDTCGLQSAAWKMREYLAKHSPDWLKELVLQRKIGVSEAYEALRYCKGNEDVLRMLVEARIRGVFPRRHEMREWMKHHDLSEIDTLKLAIEEASENADTQNN